VTMNEYWQLYPVRRGWDSVQPIYDLVGRRGYIAGSYAAFMAAPNDTPMLPGDVDVFATSADNAEEIVADILDQGMVEIWRENPTCYTLTRSGGLLTIQIVKPNPAWQIWPDDILNDFDLDVSRAVLLTPETVLADKNIGSANGKVLRINNPLRSLKRIVKYAARGVNFTDHELLKLFRAWEQLPGEERQEMISTAAQAVTDYALDWDDDYAIDWDDDYAIDWDDDCAIDWDDDWFEGE
jgi:hypothetical protein